jgi:F0F1-type ATP synthase membrane subunit b/b'
VTEENHEVPESTPPPEPEERRSWFRHTSRRILDRDTRSGRLIHTALIHIIVSGVAFAIGMLVMYLWLYRPVANQLTTAQGERAAITTELEQAQAAHEQTRAELQAAEDQVQSLEQTVESQEHQLERAAARIHLLRVMYHSRVAQSALQNRDQAAARRAVGEARRELDAALPMIESEDEEVAQSLTLRLDLVSNGMARDPTTARSDLEILINNLILLERLLAQRTTS